MPPEIPAVEEDLVFICGALRSGTTLLRLMVNDNPRLTNPGEMDFLFEQPPRRGGRLDARAFARDLSFNRVFASLDLTIDEQLAHDDQIRDFVRQLRRPAKRLSINIHRHFTRVPEIFPSARFVHLLRDPRDVAKSSIGMGWAGNVYHGVDHWIASEREFEDLAGSIEPGRIHELSYESILADPENELARLCGFMGVPYDASMLDYPSHTTYGPPDAKLASQWRREMTDREVALVEAKAGAMLKVRGYDFSSAAPLTPRLVEKVLLRTHDRYARWRESIRRYGLFLTALEKIGERFRLDGLRAYVKKRRAPITRNYLK